MNGMNGHTHPPDYLARLETFRKSDGERDALVAELIRNYEELQLKYTEKCDDYSNEVESRRMWQGKASSHERALVEHKQAAGSNSFVLVIIDGDGAVFQDYLYSMGKDGGSDAAHLLHTEIKSNLKATYPDANVDDWNVVVQVVLNLQGLASKLQACNIVMNPNEVVAFGRAFSLAQPLFSFIDVGSGKERADHKVRETLRLFLPNAQCKHVFFGPCCDNGYAVVLESYKRDFASRLTLIETRPAEQSFVDLCLKRIRFPSIFRSDNLPGKPAMTMVSPSPSPAPVRSNSTMQMQANSVPFIPKSASPAPSTDSGASSSWASVGKSGSTTKTINIAPKKSVARRCVFVNLYDERVDQELPRSDPGAEKRFGDRIKAVGKCCNNYHLLGKCDSGEYCDYNHGERLSPGEQLVLKHKARSRSCPRKLYCRDVDCTYGHHCKFGKSCYLDNCWFSDTHQMELEPAKKMYEDGSEEWIQTYLNKIRT